MFVILAFAPRIFNASKGAKPDDSLVTLRRPVASYAILERIFRQFAAKVTEHNAQHRKKGNVMQISVRDLAAKFFAYMDGRNAGAPLPTIKPTSADSLTEPATCRLQTFANIILYRGCAPGINCRRCNACSNGHTTKSS